jgi:AcrR family transcriptional regulator
VSSSAAPTLTATRRHLNARQAETAQRVIDAARAELREVGYDELTVRSVAGRAHVAPATAYTYFASKHHLVVEIFWRAIRERSHPPSPLSSSAARVAAVFDDLARFLADDPELGRAATSALLCDEPDVKQLRELIGNEINERIVAAAGPRVAPEVLEALAVAWSGAMLQAGMGHTTYVQMGERLGRITALILRGAR